MFMLILYRIHYSCNRLGARFLDSDINFLGPKFIVYAFLRARTLITYTCNPNHILINLYINYTLIKKRVVF